MATACPTSWSATRRARSSTCARSRDSRACCRLALIEVGRWSKVARVVAQAMREGGFSVTDENVIRLHVRQISFLVETGALEAEGNLRQPRWCEVRTTGTPSLR